MVGWLGGWGSKTWLAYSRNCAWIWTQALLRFFFNMDPLPNDGAPGCYRQLSNVAPPMGLYQRGLSRFQAGMGCLKSAIFG